MTQTEIKEISFSQGDKIYWSSIVGGKIVRLKGDIVSIVGEDMCCIGKCVATGTWWRDYISIKDNSIIRVEELETSK